MRKDTRGVKNILKLQTSEIIQNKLRNTLELEIHRAQLRAFPAIKQPKASPGKRGCSVVVTTVFKLMSARRCPQNEQRG